MNKATVLLLLVAVAFLAISCGSGSGRQLQSIAITQTLNGQQIEFVATGTFSKMPTTVTPLPVDWGGGFLAPPPGILDYRLTTEPLVVNCTSSGPNPPVAAWAPSNPNAPSAGSWPFKKMVVATASVTCP
jgi:hypothetical protein